MHRYLVTGTEADAGKTRVSAALALALRQAGEKPTVVKLVQTGLAPGIPGDAARAGKAAGTRYLEVARLEKPGELHAYELIDALDAIDGAVVAEGAAGIRAPLNPTEQFAHVALKAKLEVVIAVGLRAGCLNRALLTITQCEALRIPVAGGVLVERWDSVEHTYRDDVTHALQGKLRILGILPFEPDEAASVAEGAKLFASLVNQ